MKHFFAALLALGLSLELALAQTFPAVPAAPPASLQDQALRTWLTQNWYDGKRTVLSYSAARAKMYNYADNFNNTVTCVYSGYSVARPLNFNNSSTSITNINCEHTVPQSWFDEAVRMQSDMHHLFPTVIQWNSDRGSDPFAEIPDAQTQKWIRFLTSQSTIPSANIDEYSEDTNTQFEPREDHKGNLARAVFYFYTVHAGQTFDTGKGMLSAVGNPATLYQWHLQDPVDAREQERNRRVAASQGNYNPYINDPSLVARAWGFQPAGPAVSFAAASGSIAEGNAGTTTYTFTLTANPAPTAAGTVQVAVDPMATTATSPADYTFSTQTVTFAAGQTTQTVTLAVNGDTQPEADETVRLVLQNATSGLTAGSPASHDFTITNDDGAPATVSFAAASGSITEGNTGTVTYTTNVTLTGTVPSAGFTVPVSVVSTSSTAGAADFTLNTTLLTFAASTTPQTLPVTVTVTADALAEGDELVVLRLGQPSNAVVLLSTNPEHTLTITDDDLPPLGTPCTRPFFSQYIEGAVGNTKAIEIFNPAPYAINLNGLRVQTFTNGANTPLYTLNLTGMLASGETYVIANAQSEQIVIDESDITSDVTFFNGDDAIALFQGTDTLDVIGRIGQDPGTNWPIPSGGSTLDNTLVRRPNVSRGQPRWNLAAAEWQAVGVGNYQGMGSHTSTACVTTSTRALQTVRGGLYVYPNPASGRVQVQVPGLSARASAHILLVDALGRPVRQLTQTLGAADIASLELRGLSAGLYQVVVEVGSKRYTSRVVVQP
ncbi:endonuclease [Hymenobacter koreensis]|uniref:T9SS type A sorting domain-containing protein n=1 Tax=Hymenobacter koreensis TaxID=1084523 RepID=A0ABP8IZM8_9BACT